MTIKERVPTIISPDILDTIGASFSFKHGKGIAEWLKNSLDNYLRLRGSGKEPLEGSWPLLLNAVDANSQAQGPNLAVIDFGGTSYQNVREFFLHWGDKSAATHGGASRAAVTGGHGNGGKFYMRQMWRGGARFATWRDGRFTSLVVEKAHDGTTGYWEVQNESRTWREALDESLKDSGLGGGNWAEDYLSANDPNILHQLENQSRGFTVVVGRRAKQSHTSNDVVKGGRWDRQKLVDEIHDSSQARRPLRELKISVFFNGELSIDRLSPSSIEVDPNWEVTPTRLPSTLDSETPGAESLGTLVVRKSLAPLTGINKEQNSLFVVDGNQNPVAHYPLRNLPFAGHSSLLTFIQAELTLDFPGLRDLIENDRERLITSPTSDAILDWVCEAILSRVIQVEEQQRQAQKQKDLELAKHLNNALNDHAKSFLQELQTQIMVDYVEDDTGGGFGDSGTGRSPSGAGKGGEGPRNRGTGGGRGEDGTRETEGASQPAKQNLQPQVLLSGFDPDPSRSDGLTKTLTDWHPPLHQDEEDLKFNVWWINTAHPFAEVTISYGGPKGLAFRNYQLSMFRDVVQREALRALRRRGRELDLEVLENELSDVSSRFLAELPRDLVDALLQT